MAEAYLTASGTGTGTGTGKVLVVDDKPANLDLMVDCLEQEGYHVVVALNGEEAIERARLVQPSLILLDILLPDFSGFEVCQQLKSDELTQSIPVIFMTALSDTQDKVKGFQAGGVDYICKPFQIEEVLARVNTHLTLKRTQQALTEQNFKLKWETELRNTQTYILEMISTNTPITRVLSRLMEMIESLSPDMTATTCLLDESGKRIKQCISPSLPHSYSQALCGIEIGPKVGSCGTAMYTQKPVLVSNIYEDPLWEGYTQLVEPFGMITCWSNPLIAPDGKVLGSFALYYKNIRSPNTENSRLLETASHLAVIALERERNQQKIEHMAKHDALTDLPNRIMLKDRLQQAIAGAKRRKSNIAVLFADLDGFKQINDTYGHHVGDQLLQTTASKLTSCLREVDIVARWGGDEFVLVLQDVQDASRLIVVIEKILSILNRLQTVNEHKIQLGCSIGISLYPTDGKDPDSLLRAADMAMYEAKETPNIAYQFFHPELNSAVSRRIQIISGLDSALSANELSLLYQPKLHLETEKITGVEAILQWQHPELGVLTQEEMTPAMAESELTADIGNWVIATACKQAAKWKARGLTSLQLSVELFPSQIRRGSQLVEFVKDTMTRLDLEPEWLDLSFTENDVTKDPDGLNTLQQLADYGVHLTLSHFGSAHSSLSFLMQAPVHCLKTDKSIIQKLNASDHSQAVVKSIIGLTRHLNICHLASGVDSREKLEILQNLSCDEIQGYCFCRALTPEDMQLMLLDKQSHHAS